MKGHELQYSGAKWLALRAVLLSCVIASCGSDPLKEKSGGEETSSSNAQSSTTVIQAPAARSNEPMLTIPVTFGEAFESKTSFGLASPVSTYSIDLTNCVSGYTTTVTQANTDGLEVYRYDRGCLAKLTTFTFNSKTYYPTTTDPFTTWQVGDTAIFDESGEPGNSPLNLVILSTLGNPVTGAESINYAIRYDLKGGNRGGLLYTAAGASGTYELGSNSAPSFTVKSIEFVSFSATEAGQFKFVLECTADIGITNICNTVPLADTDYKLVEDTYGSAPTDSDCSNIFAGGGISTITLPDDRVAPGAMGTANGGFVTVTLTGPVPLATKPNMILLLRSYGTSFQYFNIDVATTPTY